MCGITSEDAADADGELRVPVEEDASEVVADGELVDDLESEDLDEEEESRDGLHNLGAGLDGVGSSTGLLLNTPLRSTLASLSTS